MIKKTHIIVLVGLLIGVVSSVEAALPDRVNFQGRLTNSSGTPLSGDYDFVIRFYDAVTGGTLLLTDSHTAASGGAVTVSGGIYSLELGGGTITAGSESTLKDVFNNNTTVYIEIDVEGETLTPRTQLLSSGFAINTDSVDGYDASTTPGANQIPVVDASSDLTLPGDLTLAGGEVVLTPQSTPSGTTEGTVYYDADDDALLYQDNDSWETITRGGGVNLWADQGTYINPINVGTGFQIQDGGDLSVSGNIGIGTTTTFQFLELGSSVLAQDVYIGLDAAAGQAAGVSFDSAGARTTALYRPAGATDLRIWSESLGVDMVTFSPGTGIGIGTTVPSAELHLGRSDSAEKESISLDAAADQEVGIAFYAAGTEATSLYRPANSVDMRIQSPIFGSDIITFDATNGRVGIGTTSPQRTLHVAGSEGMALAPAKAPSTPAAGDLYIDLEDSNTLKWYDGSAWQTSGGYDTDWIIVLNNMYSGVSGNVGIGTTDPGEFKLQVNGDIGMVSNNTNTIGTVTNMTTMDQNLSTADASFWGEDAGDWSGSRISGAGDVNGDGYDDFLIGASGDEDGGANAGQTYLIFGSASGWAMDTDLSGADASFIGEAGGDYSGYSVSGAGDVNGDGYDDFLIGAFGNDEGGSGIGQTYLVFGKASGWSMDQDLSDADASFIGENQAYESGRAVSGVGDVNGDGYDDFLIGAWRATIGGNFDTGEAYLIFGKATGWSIDTDLAQADASFVGEDSSDRCGSAVSGAGDVNGDGYDDLLIAARFDEEGGGIAAGQTYLIFGKASGWNVDTNVSTADASFIGENGNEDSGWSISGVGDVDGDGYDDFLISAVQNSEGGTNAGQTYLILGKTSGWSMDTDLSGVDASFIGENSWDRSGNSVSRAGDVNGDGYDDFLISSRQNSEGSSETGQTYLILGKTSSWSMDTNLSTADASFIGEDATDYSGASVTGAGDVNGDGYDDFLIGALGDEEGGGANAGQTYLILSDERQFDSIMARHIHAGNSLTVGNLKLQDETISSSSQLYLDANKVSVLGGFTTSGSVGVRTTQPARRLHVNGPMRLEPRSSAPASPSAGDMYFDSSTNKLRVYDGSAWQDCW